MVGNDIMISSYTHIYIKKKKIKSFFFLFQLKPFLIVFGLSFATKMQGVYVFCPGYPEISKHPKTSKSWKRQM